MAKECEELSKSRAGYSGSAFLLEAPDSGMRSHPDQILSFNGKSCATLLVTKLFAIQGTRFEVAVGCVQDLKLGYFFVQNMAAVRGSLVG